MHQPEQEDDDGVIRFKRLHPEHFDVVLGSHPAKQKVPRPAQPKSYGMWVLVLILVGMLGYMTVNRNSSHPIPVAPLPADEPVPIETAKPSEAPVEPVSHPEPTAKLVPAPAPQVVVVVQTQAPAAAAHAAAPPTPKVQGLVSASYLAGYQANLNAPEARQTRQYEIATVSIREWDGRDRYQAKWRIFNNVIDNASVCGNFLAGSTERRECRKSAEVFFKEQCGEWGKRWDRDQDEKSKEMQVRYCTAMKTYSAAE
ncbi:hypothetical protein [Pseudomonas sp. MWU12-2345]|uniref:hypothetical protein n=1 Tax=Pseudomonas sp. MWU12-2345 TaxID=2928689 RepID=UPI00200D4F4E|nr:hypothetical protein [Pseudomonas sp. MWU12-2345]